MCLQLVRLFNIQIFRGERTRERERERQRQREREGEKKRERERERGREKEKKRERETESLVLRQLALRRVRFGPASPRTCRS